MGFRTVNPATGELLKEFPFQTDEEIRMALHVAHERYHRDWKHRPVTQRAQFVARAGEILRTKRDEYARLLTLEMGKVIGQAYYEVDLAADILAYYGKHAGTFLQPRAVPDVPDAVIITEPIGALLAIEPWNFPYYQIARVAAPQIAAGNVLLMKQAQEVPQSALAFARLFVEAGTPEGVYTNLFCTVEQAGCLIDDFRIRGVTLTGSERAGAAVAERAGRNLKKVVLELGGSDPAIVLEDAPIEQAVRQCVLGRMINSGQACASIKRMIVVGRERGAQILQILVEQYAALPVGEPSDPASAIGPLVSERAVDGLIAQIHAAKAAGARIVCGGRRMNRPGFYVEPTIITDIAGDNPFFHQEAFGPVLSFHVVDTEDEAIHIANATKFGLGSSVFSADIERAKRVADRIEAGMVFINSFVNAGPEVPFGGVKNSGFGRELSELGIAEFVNRKLVRVAQIEPS
ncbi:aldehyde dehydrogenase family protein [Paraburkholderia sp. SOS3]|jgi:succinate-semialdehyde dehydrogenase/glutarate-semialdehyde dehydrogenase|uniref:aldehyde dehydrogenase family protein n=1 Tax=Paraburkholderia sp. SOS3 TaxID=1926494 RepID=UPI0009473922|nr:aldehyde dehydrogenase family protein [Paraburkholderia sp. SOS3]APR35940.1 succinate-semialdehyde dehydrogenase [Paraburkholderia sp. SOS3]